MWINLQNVVDLALLFGGLALASLVVQWLLRIFAEWYDRRTLPKRLERMMETPEWKQRASEWAKDAAQREFDGKWLEQVWYRGQLEKWHNEYRVADGKIAPFAVWAGMATQEQYDAWALEASASPRTTQ